MRFNSHTNEQSCGKRVPGALSDKYADLGGVACMRTAGHDGECAASALDAGIADGVHWCCRSAIGAPHTAWCHLRGGD